jgi:hypothetical protein
MQAGTGMQGRRCLVELTGTKPVQAVSRNGGLNMADKSSLGLLGFLFGGITFAVTVIAFLVVRDHVEGRLILDEVAMAPQLASMSVR